MKTSIKFLLLLLALCKGTASYAQDLAYDQRAQATVKSFLEAVYASSLPVSDVAIQYIALSTSVNEFSAEKRYELAANHIQLLRENKSMGTFEVNRPVLNRITVIPYSKLSKSQALSFEADSHQLQHIYAAVENGNVIRYFVYQNGKINSFDFLMKGKEGPRYFITY